MRDVINELPAMIRRRAALFREMAATATSPADRHDYRFQAQRLEKQANDIEQGKPLGRRPVQ